MSTQGIFDNFVNQNSSSEIDSPKQRLWNITWRKIETFLPNFIRELFPSFTPPVLEKTTPKAQDGDVRMAEVPDSQMNIVRTPSPVAEPSQVASGRNSSSPPVEVGRSPQNKTISGM